MMSKKLKCDIFHKKSTQTLFPTVVPIHKDAIWDTSMNPFKPLLHTSSTFLFLSKSYEQFIQLQSIMQSLKHIWDDKEQSIFIGQCL
jgi:hypothetical protein